MALKSDLGVRMHRTQISLEEQQYEHLVAESRRRSISLSAIIRQLVSEHLEKQSTPLNPLDQIAGIGEGDGQSVGREHNRFLYGKSDQ